MRRWLYLLCFAVVSSCNGVAFADSDYYRALKSADVAIQLGDFEGAARTVRVALRKYENDYALTLKLAWVQFQWGHYDDAERLYKTAIDLSDGSLDARVGLGWALIEQDRCEEAVRVLRGVLAEEADEAAERGLETCADRARVHGALWGTIGGSLYRDHPWLRLAAAASLGFSLQPIRTVTAGGAYRFSKLSPTDARIPGFSQHEAYVQSGYTGTSVDLLGQAALVWGGDTLLGSSRHVGALLRIRSIDDHVSSVLFEASGSFYPDLWVIGMTPSATVTFGLLSLTAGVAAQQFAHDTLFSASLSSTLVLGTVSVWAGGKLGPEYRAAYLSQFAVFNAEERSTWALSAGARLNISAQWSLHTNYALLHLQSPDGISSLLHNLNLSAAFSF